jgi:hypothetical protein
MFPRLSLKKCFVSLFFQFYLVKPHVHETVVHMIFSFSKRCGGESVAWRGGYSFEVEKKSRSKWLAVAVAGGGFLS